MPKLQDQGLVSPDEIQSAQCPLCSAVLTFTRNKNDEYYSEHCVCRHMLNVDDNF